VRVVATNVGPQVIKMKRVEVRKFREVVAKEGGALTTFIKSGAKLTTTILKSAKDGKLPGEPGDNVGDMTKAKSGGGKLPGTRV